jgi:TonB family protein
MLRALVLTLLILTGCSANNSIKVPKKCANFQECVSLIKLKIQSNLIVEDSFRDHKVLIEFFLDDSGAVKKYSISSSTGVTELEEAAKEAIYKSSPFAELLSLSKSDFDKFKHIKLTVEPDLG